MIQMCEWASFDTLIVTAHSCVYSALNPNSQPQHPFHFWPSLFLTASPSQWPLTSACEFYQNYYHPRQIPWLKALDFSFLLWNSRYSSFFPLLTFKSLAQSFLLRISLMLRYALSSSIELQRLVAFALARHCSTPHYRDLRFFEEKLSFNELVRLALATFILFLEW